MTETQRRVVFNADDLGESTKKNAGVLAAARAGIVREASLLVTGNAVEDALQSLRESGLPLGIGLHFSLTLGRALAGPISGLTKSDGRFASLPQVLLHALSRSLDPAAIERELRAQVERLRALGFTPTHLNGHHHVHVLPGIRDAVLAVLKDLPGLHVRVPLESGFPASARLAVIRAFASRFTRRARRELGEISTLPFVGLALSHSRDHAREFARLARALEVPAAEWVVHPLPEEVATLVDPKTSELLSELGIVASSYSELTTSVDGDSESAARSTGEDGTS